MSDALRDPPFGGNPGDPVADVDPEDLKTMWQRVRDLIETGPGQGFGMTCNTLDAFCKPGANAEAVWYRSTMIWVLSRFAQDQLAPWVRNEEVSDAVFRTMATIPMEWIGHTEREGFPFDIEEFFRRLAEDGGLNS